MTHELTIRQVADATGFTTATLRYYEHIGLLPDVARTPSGYRTYDQGALDRLAFIGRAKQLGCSLEEIAGLTAAWDGGRCEPIQEQLRALVGSRINEARRQIRDLMTVTAELEHAARSLEARRSDGACDTTCGCRSEPSASRNRTVTDLRLTPKAARHGARELVPDVARELVLEAARESVPEIACTLSAESMNERITDWQALLVHVIRRERIDRGVRCVLVRSVPVAALTDLVAAEHACCQFLEFAITVDTRGIALEVRAPEDAGAIVESMFGAPS